MMIKGEQPLLIPTPIQYMGRLAGGQDVFMKRDDLLGFSFGGNKFRIAMAFLEDMERKGGNFMVSYGSPASNLNRTVASLCKSRKVPCLLIVSKEEGAGEQTFNRQIAENTGAEQVVCGKNHVALTVEQVMEDLKSRGYRPYYLYGNQYGLGNEAAARKAYLGAYEEIRRWEEERVELTHIFCASGTGMTQGGLVAGKIAAGGREEIVGISVARDEERGSEAVRRYAGDGAGTRDVVFEADYRCGGYGLYDPYIERVIEEMMDNHGIALDPTYTGKAYAGMMKWLERYGTGEEKVLFIHTGGLPLYFDYLNRKRGEKAASGASKDRRLGK